MTQPPTLYTDPGKIADAIIAAAGKNIVLGLPLGLGKANHIANALVERAMADPALQLKIFTALTLEKPHAKSELERRFLEPALPRLIGNYPALTYARHLREVTLPANIQVNEFFLVAGQWRNVAKAQQNYIAANYSQALSYLLANGVNVVAQLVAERASEYSLSSNPDLTIDLLKERQSGRVKFIFAGQVNSELPFMAGDAAIPGSEFSFVLKSPETDFELFSIPRKPVDSTDYAIGLHAATLVRDGGTLQIGIGSVGDAITKSLILRHANNDLFKKLVNDLGGNQVPALYNDAPFETGVHGISEMFVDGFLHLAKNGILKRRVDGALLYAAFFADTRDFYKTLREMSEEQRSLFQMKPISFTNTLYGSEAQKRAARVKASFINDTMIVNLRGAAISDGLDNGQVVSGVGGQHDFVTQAFALEGARSILVLPAARQAQGKTFSNIVWAYSHETIPWHLRDIIITEYGIADLRGQPDAEVIARLLAITDSRFQQRLLIQAKKAGKIERSYKIPDAYCRNTPQRIAQALKAAQQSSLLPLFPFGTDFTEIEQRLLPVLEVLKVKSSSPIALLQLLLRGVFADPPSGVISESLARMSLGKTSNLKDWFYQKILHGAFLED
jgi:acyl-CoA hydrolase